MESQGSPWLGIKSRARLETGAAHGFSASATRVLREAADIAAATAGCCFSSIPKSLTDLALVVQVKLHVLLWKRPRSKLAGR